MIDASKDSQENLEPEKSSEFIKLATLQEPDLESDAGGRSGSSPQAKKSTTAFFIELALLFALALLLRLLFNFVFIHVNNFASCDAFEYINNGQALLALAEKPPEFWLKSLSSLLNMASPADTAAVKEGLAPLKDFYISGPVFPAFLAIVVAIFGGIKANVHWLWQPLLFANSIVSALTCVFIYLSAAEAYDRRTARLAGIFSAIYPGFVINSGRLYSEVFAAFLLSMISYITLRGFRAGGNKFRLVFLSGFLAAALQMTRSVMVVLSLALLPLNSIQQKGRRKLTFFLPFVLGFCLVAVPWLAFQQLAFGKGGLLVDRVGNYNLFIGNNIDTQGWLSYPYPDGRNIESSSFPKILASAIEKSPARWFRLMLDKPLRLFKYPWNDFRTAIGTVSFKWQVLLHEFLAFLGFCGIALCLFGNPVKKLEPRQLYCRLYLAGLFAFHFIYCLFITVPRYNLCAIPELLIFAAAAVSFLISLFEKNAEAIYRPADKTLLAGSLLLLFVLLQINLLPYLIQIHLSPDLAWITQAALRISFLLAAGFAAFKAAGKMPSNAGLCRAVLSLFLFLALPLLALPLRANGRHFEWYSELDSTSPEIKQLLRIPAYDRSPDAVYYLLLDSQGVRQCADGLELKVNGELLEGPVLASMSFAENFDRFLELGPQRVQREGERMWYSLISSAGSGNLDLRQWSMLPLPQSIVSKAKAQAKASGADKLRFEVSLKNRSDRKLRIYGAYRTSSKEHLIPSVSLYSWEKAFYGVENNEWLTDTRYDIKAPGFCRDLQKDDLSEQAGLQNGSYNFAVLKAPPVAENNTLPAARSDATHLDAALFPVSSYKLGSLILKQANSNTVSVDLGDQKNNLKSDSLWIVRLQGKSRVLSGNALPAANIELSYLKKDGSRYAYNSAWTPSRLESSGSWKEFDFSLPARPLVENARAEKALINFNLVNKQSPYLNVKEDLKGEIEFQDLCLELYCLPANPIGLGHLVY